MKPTAMEHERSGMLDALCNILDDEIERQENVLAVLQAQQEAIAARDADAITARTLALDVLTREAKEAERERLALVSRIVETWALPVESQTLSKLINASPAREAGRLQERQSRLRDVVLRTRRQTHASMNRLRQAARSVDEQLAMLLPASQRQPAAAYGGSGARNAPEPPPAAIDSKG